MNWPEIVAIRSMLLVAPLERPDLTYLSSLTTGMRYDLCLAWALEYYDDLDVPGVDDALRARFGDSNLIVVLARTAHDLLEHRLFRFAAGSGTSLGGDDELGLDLCGPEMQRLVRSSNDRRSVATAAGVSFEQAIRQLWTWRNN